MSLGLELFLFPSWGIFLAPPNRKKASPAEGGPAGGAQVLGGLGALSSPLSEQHLFL